MTFNSIIKYWRSILLVSLGVGLTVVVGVLNYLSQLSLLASVRFLVLYVLLGFLVVFLGFMWWRSKRWWWFWWVAALGLITMVNLASFGFNRWYFYHHTDLETEDHLIVGYRSQKEVMSLVKENKIAGVYVTHRNVKGKTPGQMREFVQELQRERLRHSQEKLVILADQEGGVVSHLSPPLTYTESLGEVYQKGGLSEVKKIAATHGRGLQELGVTVNLAPVADLQAKNSAGGYSQINRRAISDKPQVVQEVVEVYCQTLAEYEVKCTLKHFPGIGGVKADTHFELGEKRGEKSELVKEMEVFSGPGVESWVMVSHTKAPQLDIHKPSSLSSKALSKVEEVNPSATTITDDFSMLPISQGVGMNQAYRQSLEAGVDYVLVSYDKELMYRLR